MYIEEEVGGGKWAIRELTRGRRPQPSPHLLNHLNCNTVVFCSYNFPTLYSTQLTSWMVSIVRSRGDCISSLRRVQWPFPTVLPSVGREFSSVCFTCTHCSIVICCAVDYYTLHPGVENKSVVPALLIPFQVQTHLNCLLHWGFHLCCVDQTEWFSASGLKGISAVYHHTCMSNIIFKRVSSFRQDKVW